MILLSVMLLFVLDFSDANLGMVGRHVVGMSAMQALNAQYSEARKTAIAAHKFLERMRLVYHCTLPGLQMAPLPLMNCMCNQ